jgi:hypothetical protein
MDHPRLLAVIVHLFKGAKRQFYSLENLWVTRSVLPSLDLNGAVCNPKSRV